MNEPAGQYTHRPVLLDEALTALRIKPEGVYVDGTFGRGGHAIGILQQLSDAGRLIAFDKDPVAVATAEQRLGEDRRFRIVHGSFTMLKQVIDSAALVEKIDGILLDLGVSSPQLDDPTRGFSFQGDGPLDMRMDTSTGETAAQWLNRAPLEEISLVIRDLGEERFHFRIASAIVRARAEKPFATTRELTAVIEAAVPTREQHKHPATRTFQAIRIHINSELADLDSVLSQCVDVLAPGGRLVVISFHSLEDRRVKRFIRDHARPKPVPRGLPVIDDVPPLRKIGKAIRAGENELAANPRARSAVLRVAEKAA